MVNSYINPWCDKKKIYCEFDKLFLHFSDSILVVSYRLDGIPSIDEICDIMSAYKKNIKVYKNDGYKYALSHKITNEVLIIGS